MTPVVTSWAVAGQQVVFLHMYLQTRVKLRAFPVATPRGRSSSSHGGEQHFYSVHQPLNQTYKIVGYHGQWRIQCCLQKLTKERHLRRQDVMQTLNSDVSWFLPFFQILPAKNTPLRYSCLATPKLCNTELLEATNLATIHSRSSAHKCFHIIKGTSD